MKELEYVLERTIFICAERRIVFQFFTDSARWADWWGAGSEIEGRPGGSLFIRFPNNITASGQVLEVEQDRRIVFTYGFDSGKPIPPGSSRVTVTLEDHPEGTRLHLRHEFDNAAARDEHIQGWRYQLALFANVAAGYQHAEIQNRIDSFFEVWNLPEAGPRKQKMETLLDAEIRFQDMHSCTMDVDDLNAHIQAGKQFMPGLTIERNGEVRLCQGMAIAGWNLRRKDGTTAATGTNVFELAPDGRFRRITGFWQPA